MKPHLSLLSPTSPKLSFVTTSFLLLHLPPCCLAAFDALALASYLFQILFAKYLAGVMPNAFLNIVINAVTDS